MKAILIGLAVLGAATASAADAALVTWTFDNAVFEDGGEMSGFLTLDTSSSRIVNWDIEATGGTWLVDFDYDPTSSYAYYQGDTLGVVFKSIPLFDDGLTRTSRFLYLTVAGLASRTTPLALPSASTYECLNCSPWRKFVSGNLVYDVPAVPEPASWALMIGGLGLAGAALRHRPTRIRFA